MLPPTPRALVFDLDGLLVDTESKWTIAEQTLFARHGRPYGAAEKALLIGRTVESSAREMARLLDREGEHEPIMDELVAEVDALILAGVSPMPGAATLVSILSGRLPIAVASNSSRAYVDLVLAHSGLDAYFPVRVGVDEVARGKPAPDPYLRACSLLDAEPTLSVAFEDTALGARSAIAAGMRVVGVPSMPDPPMVCDLLVASLDDPALLAWASSI